MSNKAFIAIPKSLFEDNNLSHQERMKRVEELVEKQLLHDEFKPISPKMLAIGRSPKKELIAIPKLKFRVGDKVECMMIATSDYDDLSDLFCILKNDADTGYISGPMQSTGFEDVNGEEIFEGDIIATDNYGYLDYGRVFYSSETASFRVAFVDEELDLDEVECDYVAGNIYENPEFLEEAE